MEASISIKPQLPEKIVLKPAGRRLPRISPLFMLTVFLPTVIAGLYYGLIASKVYVSEAHFVVTTSQQSQSATGLSQLLQTAGFSHAQDESAAVDDFITSRDALSGLEEHMNLLKAYGDPTIDRFTRFAGLDWWDHSFESFFKYYSDNIVSVTMDSSSSISTLKVRAFSARQAYRINAMLLDRSEKLINVLNRRISEDMIKFASQEVDKAEIKAKEAAVALAQYRIEHALFDPVGQAGLELQGVSKLQQELADTRAGLAQVRSASPSSPALPVLEERARALNSEIGSQMARVSGGRLSFSQYGPKYEKLKLDDEFAAKNLEVAMASLEQARNEAIRKEYYLQRIVEPAKPDYAMEPRRLRAVCTTFLLGLLAWGSLGLLLAGVREHHE